MEQHGLARDRRAIEAPIGTGLTGPLHGRIVRLQGLRIPGVTVAFPTTGLGGERKGFLARTDLDGILRAKGVRQLFLAGIATNWIVESTTRYGAELGYDITVLEDCCQGFSDELHDFAITKTLPFYATIAKSTDFIDTLG